MNYGVGSTDDIDHLGNRRLRTVGELLQNQIRIGLSRMERTIKERMTTQDIAEVTPQGLMNIRPVTAAVKSSSEVRSCRSSWTRTILLQSLLIREDFRPSDLEDFRGRERI